MSNRTSPEARIARPVRFFPATDGRGKWHAASRVTGTAVCGNPADLAITGGEWITTTAGDRAGSVHPIACRSCLGLTAVQGVGDRGTV